MGIDFIDNARKIFFIVQIIKRVDLYNEHFSFVSLKHKLLVKLVQALQIF